MIDRSNGWLFLIPLTNGSISQISCTIKANKMTNPKSKKYDRVIKFEKSTLAFPEFLSFVKQLQGLGDAPNVLLDLTNIFFAHPSGMAPIVANIRYFHSRGWIFDVALPDEPLLADYFRKAGWIQGIEGTRLEIRPGRPNDTFIPLLQYTNHHELNLLINEALRHFSRIASFKKGVFEALEWALNEVADNVLVHSGGATGWIQLAQQPKKHQIEIVVVDCGRGILDSLREGHPELKNDAAALEKAVEKGVTRNSNIGQGNGLAGTLRIAIAAGGFANLYSGQGLLRYFPKDTLNTLNFSGIPHRSASEHLHIETVSYVQGTIVSLTLPTNRDLDVAHALWGRSPTSVFENQYLSETGEQITYRVADEATGFGNRASAKPLRIAVENLISQFPDQKVSIDFTGVNIVSASFADEFVARLAKSIGVMTFFSRVNVNGMNDFVRRTMDAVMEQRLRS